MSPGGRLVHEAFGAALVAWQESRRAGYGDLSQHRLLVFAVDEYGMMLRDAHTLLRECVAVREDWLDVEGRYFTGSCRTFSSFWKQRLSGTLARRLACLVLKDTTVVCSRCCKRLVDIRSQKYGQYSHHRKAMSRKTIL
jgi:hypothetical protein